MRRFDLFLLAALILQLFIFFANDPSEDVINNNFTKPPLGISGIDALSIEMQGQTINFVKDPNVGWCLDLPQDKIYPLKDKVMPGFLARLYAYRPGPIRGDSTLKAKEFQVHDENPYARIILKNKSSQKEIFIAPAANESDYFRLKGDKNIHQLQPSIRWWLSADENKWVDNKLGAFQWQVQNFTWKNSKRSAVKIGSSGLKWRSNGRELNKESVDLFVKEFSSLKIDDLISLHPQNGDKTFDSTCILTFNSTRSIKQSATFYINGKKTTFNGRQGYQVMLKGDGRLVFIDEKRFKELVELGPYIFTK
jgi:hypothetical protein